MRCRKPSLARQPEATVIVHSDRGLNPFSIPGIPRRAQSIRTHRIDGRVASAGDNAAMESFFALLQTNVLNRRRWRARPELSYVIHWIEHTHSRRRPQRGLGELTGSSSNSPSRAIPRRTFMQHDQSQPSSTRSAADPWGALPACSPQAFHYATIAARNANNATTEKSVAATTNTSGARCGAIARAHTKLSPATVYPLKSAQPAGCEVAAAGKAPIATSTMVMTLDQINR